MSISDADYTLLVDVDIVANRQVNDRGVFSNSAILFTWGEKTSEDPQTRPLHERTNNKCICK